MCQCTPFISAQKTSCSRRPGVSQQPLPVSSGKLQRVLAAYSMRGAPSSFISARRWACKAGSPKRRSGLAQSTGEAGEMLHGFSLGNLVDVSHRAYITQQAGQYDVEAVRDKVKQLIANNQVMVFSLTECPSCEKVKDLLAQLGAKYAALDLDCTPNGRAIRAELMALTDRTSLPNVFLGGVSVGGCQEGPGVLPLYREGKLIPMLRDVGAL